ncbi:hypothetical protein DFH08DRAFT_824017 [Mycena albidolilacea]|uniref:Uncharacterized protein n=1 Tax=Mycena albidolilacea TaxID=1033008 RepID=A0AAD6Z5K3_9AGAR|nr:hypothetical protein DFH08DRAFT_824017 [Mycena albidolilacea]
MPTHWANIKTFVRKAIAVRIPPSFCLAMAYSQHGKHYDWEPRSTREDFPPIAVLPSEPATCPSSSLSDLSLSEMDGMAGAVPVQLVQVENTSSKKRKPSRSLARDDDGDHQKAPGVRHSTRHRENGDSH